MRILIKSINSPIYLVQRVTFCSIPIESSFFFVRSKFSLLNGIHKPPSDASEIFSGLIDHSSLLVQFQQLEM